MNSEVFVKLSKHTKVSSHWRKSVLVTGLISGLLIGSYNGSVAALSFDDGVEAYLAGRYENALQIWEPLAAEGDAVAMFNIGVLHAQGLGVKQDPVVAVDWYRQAADRGYAPAQFNLGASYHNGQGVERDDELAASWWQLAADQGEVQAQYHLAVLYLEGRGVAMDETTARYFLEQAARQGDSRAAETLNTLVDESQQDARTVSISDQSPESVTGIVADSGEATIEETIEEAPTASSDTTDNTTTGSTSELVVANGSTELVTPVVVDNVDTDADSSESNEPAEPRIVTAENGATVIYTTESAEMRASGSAWVHERDPNSYTIQLLATGEKAAAEKFIVDQKIEDRAYVFFSGAGDTPLYKVIYGNYSSAAEANRERKAFPDSLMKNTPWIRDFGSIQAEASEMVDTVTSESAADVLVQDTDNANDSITETSEGTVTEVVTEVVESEAVVETATVETTTETISEQVIESESVESSVPQSAQTTVLTTESTESDASQTIIVGEISSETVSEAVTETVMQSETEASSTTESTQTLTETTDPVVISSETSEAVAETVEQTAETIEESATQTETVTVVSEDSAAETLSETVDAASEGVSATETGSGVQIVSTVTPDATDSVLQTDDQQNVTTENAIEENAPAPETDTTVAAVESQVIGNVGDSESPQTVQPAVSSTELSTEQAVESFTLGQRAFNRQDYESALGHWRPLAESGHAEAQYGLGFMYETGWGVQRTANEALKWYRKSAEQGYAKAQYNLGMMYLVGNGVPADESMGLFWIQSAADQNDLRARARLSRMRANGASSTN